MASVSLAHLVAGSLVVSTVLLWVNMHDVGIRGAAAAAAIACIAIIAIQSIVAGAVPLSKPVWRAWALFLLAPTAVVILASRIGFLQAKPWMLLLVGPLAFLLAATALMIAYNILFASGHRP